MREAELLSRRGHLYHRLDAATVARIELDQDGQILRGRDTTTLDGFACGPNMFIFEAMTSSYSGFEAALPSQSLSA